MTTLTDRIAVIVDTKGDTRGLDQVQRSAKETESSFDRMGKAIGISGDTLKRGLVAGATALVGTGLLGFLQGSVRAFVDSGEAAAQFARATNSTVEEAGKFVTLAQAMGLSMNDLIEINAEFQSTIADSPELLDDLGVSIARNADGTANWTLTIGDTLDALGKMENGADAARAAVEIFGEEGSKQLAQLYLSGVDVADMLDSIDFVDNSAQAQAFNRSMLELNLAFQKFQIVIGQAIVPALTQLIDLTVPVIEFLSSFGGQGLLAAGAAAALLRYAAPLGDVMRLMGQGLSDAVFSLDGFEEAFRDSNGIIRATTTDLSQFNTKIGLVRGSIILVTGSLLLWQKGLKDARGLVAENSALLAEYGDLAKLSDKELENLARTMVDANEAGGVWGFVLDVIGYKGIKTAETMKGLREEAERQESSMGTLAGAAEDAAKSVTGLEDAVTKFLDSSGEFSVSWQDVADAASEAAEAQLEAERATNLAEIAMGQYAVSIQGALEWQERLNGVTLNAEEALNKAQEATRDLAKTKDLTKTWGDEVIIAAGKAEQAWIDYAQALAAQGLPAEKIIEDLETQRSKVGPKAAAIIDEIIASIQGKQNEIPQVLVDMKLDPKVAPLKDQIDKLLSPLGGRKAGVDKTITVRTVGAVQAQKQLNALVVTTVPGKTVNVDTRGFGETRNRLTYLERYRINRKLVDVDTRGFGETRNRLNFLRDYRIPKKIVHIDTSGFGETRDRLKYLYNFPDPYVTVRISYVETNRPPSSSRIGSAINGVSRTSNSAQLNAATVINNVTLNAGALADPVGTAKAVEGVLTNNSARMRGTPSWL